SITNTFNNKTKDAKENKGYIGVITNTGTIGKEASPLATQDITYGINNSGTIEKLINSSGDLTDPNAGKNIHIFGGINNSGYINIENTGNIHGGITNSGTLVVNNGHIHPATANNEATWHSGYIGKNNNGYQLENNTGGKISIDGWYFDELEYTQSNEQRLENSIIIGGDNLGGISADKIYVNTEKLKLQTVYEGNTFFADKDGNIVGNQTNNGTGVNANNIHSLSGIYDFVGLDNGKYVANVNLAELSGKTLAKSMVYSSRLRNINISNMLRDVTAQNFQTEFSQVLDMELSKKGEAYGNDADLLAELEDIFIPNKNPKASNHSFLLPYYNHSSIKIGKSVGQLSVNTAGLMGGSFKELPKDYGIIGFYLGYEDSSKEQATQRLKFDDKTYYGGLTYYGVIARNGIDQYYISANTKLDYTKTDIEKTYKNIPSSIKSDAKVYGYGAEVKLGANYYNTLDIARISPEIGLSYYGMSNKNFALRHIDGLKEHYMAEQFNFFDAIAAVKLYKPLSDKLRTNITIGSVVNLYNDAKGSLKLGPNEISTDMDTSKYYGFGQLGLSYAIADNADLSLNYAGAFTFDNTTSHTMFLKLGLWW
ncbi:TPA: autotransporter outer membrane beta-barrel domain-containing protein, partial [Campylobacter lari]|nr:autotransporter outer membrane beta-barrel domain-containing protein [Campylobacter lari]